MADQDATRARTNVSRRRLLQGTAGVGAAGLLGATAPKASRAFAAPMLQTGLTGEITVGFADELGKKPPYVQRAADAVTSANPGATVNVDLRQVAGGDYTTQLLLALDSGEGPDVIHIGGDRIGQLADAGYIEPLDAYLAEWPDWTAQYPEAIRNGVTYQDQVWAVPYGLDTRFLYFRRDILEQAGLGRDWEPANLDGLLEAAVAVKEAGLEGVAPYVLYAGRAGSGGTASHGFAPIVLANGGDLIDAEGRWVGDSPAIRAALAYYERAWRELEVVPQEILTATEPWKPMREGMGTGKVALLYEGGWVYGGYVTGAAEGTIDLESIGYLLHPTVDAGPSFTIGGPGTVWYINAASENKDLAWEFIKTFNNAETVAQLNLEDPHPVARQDSAALPSFQENQYLVDATASLEQARFLPVSADLAKVTEAIQTATDAIATGQSSPEEAAERYAQDLQRAVGEENVVTQ